MNAVKRHRMLLAQTVVFGLFPLLCAMVYCMKDGHVPGDVFLPSSYWNDELMYFKQVEAVVSHGLPRGWFGFNEAHGSVYPIQYDGIGGICAAGKANREAERFCTGASGSLYAVYPIYAVGNAGGALYVSGNLVCGAGHQLYQE